VLVLSLLLLGPDPVAASSSAGWKPFGLQGKTVYSLSMAGDLLCAGTAMDGVFCRPLGADGTSWEPRGLPGPWVTAIWLDPYQPGVMFAGSKLNGARIYRTSDGGTNWQQADSGTETWASIDRIDGVVGQTTLYAVGSGWFWRSGDSGDSWTPGGFGSTYSLAVPATDPNAVWIGGENFVMQSWTALSRDRGQTWVHWYTQWPGDDQTRDIATHPDQDGLAIMGHEGFVRRTANHGGQFQQVLTASTYFYVAWDRVNTRRAYATGAIPVLGGGWYSFGSEDLGLTWFPLSPGPSSVARMEEIEPDAGRLGVLYAATDDGVYRFYGGGEPLCVDSRAGTDAMEVHPGACPLPASAAEPIAGDIVVGHIGALSVSPGGIDLGEVECLLESGDVSLASIDLPEPAPGTVLFVLVRLDEASDYGASSDGLPRTPSQGDCDP